MLRKKNYYDNDYNRVKISKQQNNHKKYFLNYNFILCSFLQKSPLTAPFNLSPFLNLVCCK